MNVWLIRVETGPWEFKVMAIVGPETEEELKKYCIEKFGIHFEEGYRKGFATILDSCSVMRDRITYCEYKVYKD